MGDSGGSGDVLDVVVKVMVMDHVVLDGKMKREADRLLAHIAQADSMILAVKAGARADGFVLGDGNGGRSEVGRRGKPLHDL